MLNKINAIEQKINNGKKLIANAITDKGVTTPVDSTLETMANNINSITGGGGLEPGSMIPSSMLEPPQEIFLNNYDYNSSKICVMELEDCIFFLQGLSGELNRFDKTTKQVSKYSLQPSNEPSMRQIKKLGDKILWFSTSKRITITDLQLNHLQTIECKNTESLNSIGSSTNFSINETEDYYVIICGGASANYEYITTIHKETYEINFKKMNQISSSIKTYHYGSLIYDNHIYILGNNDMFCVDTDLNLVNFSTELKSGSSTITDNYYMYQQDGYIYMIERFGSNNGYIKKITHKTLQYENISYENSATYDKIMLADNDHVYIYSHISGKFRIYDKDFNLIKQLETQNPINSISWINIIGDKLIMQNSNNILMFDSNYNLLFDLPYTARGFSTSYNNFITCFDFNGIQKMCYIFDDKIYMFRAVATYIDVEPKYTVKARALAELPVVMSYIAKRLKNPCTKEDCEDHK